MGVKNDMLIICTWEEDSGFKKGEIYKLGDYHNVHKCNRYVVNLTTREELCCVKESDLISYNSFDYGSVFATFKPACDAVKIMFGVNNE